jgi:hypothetical protein
LALLRRDGHYGLENREARRVTAASQFTLVLAYLIEDPTKAHFVIHISPSFSYVSEFSSGRFLELLGWAHFSGHCPFFESNCYYRYVYESPVDRGDAHGRQQQVDYAHQRVQRLADALPSIYAQVHDIYAKLGAIPDLFPSLAQFGPQPLPDFSDEAPPWVGEAKVEEHRQVEDTLKNAEEDDRRLGTVEYMLWGTGDKLEEAVHFVLESELGFQVSRTPKGSTVDRLVKLPGTDIAFGVEITGLNDAIKKRSNKITQALAFLQEREGNERPIILANTYNDRPLTDRASLEDFTREALDLMTPNGIVGMTTLTLYEIWKAVTYGGHDITDIATELYNHGGGDFNFAKG